MLRFMRRSRTFMPIFKRMLSMSAHASCDGIVRANVVSDSTAISACEKAARWERALALLAAMRADALRADVIAYSMTISACEKAAQWQRR